MTHDEVVARGIADDYVAGRLSVVDRDAFEQHYFECDVCFAMLQADDRMRSAVRHLARTDAPELAGPAPVSAGRRFAPWLIAAAAVIIAAVGLWLPRQRAAELESRLAQAQARTTDLERALAGARAAGSAPTGEANVPLAILQTTRGSGVVDLKVPADAHEFVLWFEDLPGSANEPFTLTFGSSETAEPLRVTGLRRNQYGAVVATLPATRLTAGPYSVTVTGDGADTPVAAYLLAITR